MADTKYPEIDVLKKAVRDHNLKLSVERTRAYLPNPYVYIRVTLLLNKVSLLMPVCDEYEDAKLKNPVLLLQLALMECEEYEDAEDYLVWEKRGFFDNAESSRVFKLYGELGEVVPKFREIVGPDVKPINGYDFEVNASAAQKLRKEGT